MWWIRQRSTRDFQEEIESHLAFEAEDVARRDGLSPEAAAEVARRRFGNVTRAAERFHDARGMRWVERVAKHLAYALRSLRAHPGFTIAAVATLAVGIGLNTAIFTIFYSFLARPLPVRGADALVNVYQDVRGAGRREVDGMPSLLSRAEVQEYAEAPAFAAAAAYHAVDLTSPAAPNGAERGELVSCDYFRTLEARIALGRAFAPAECAHPGDGAVVVLSHDAWAAQYGADSAIVGRTIRVNNLPLTVVGVAEPEFGGISLRSAQMWIPFTMQIALTHGRDTLLTNDNASWLTMVARLAPGATIAQARAQVAARARGVDALHPGRTTRTIVARGALLNFPEAGELALAGALVALLSAMVALTACANVMNLLLARGLARRREFGIRLAVGASRGRLIEQLLVESGVLALLGGTVGLALVFALPPVVHAVAPVGGLQLDVTPDWRVIAFAVAAALATTFLFGLAPALHATNIDLVSAFKGELAIGRRQHRPSRLRRVVIGAQMAGGALLLVIAALLSHAARHAATIDPGYDTRNLFAASLNVEQLGYDTARARAVYDALVSRIAGAPGVAGVALAEQLPLGGEHATSVSLVAGRAGDASAVTAFITRCSGSYLATMGIPLLRGRAFTDADARAGGDMPAVISEAMARSLWPGADAIGRRFRGGGGWNRVTGIAADARMTSLGEVPARFAYLGAPSPVGLEIIVRTRGGAAPIVSALPAWARAIDPQVSVAIERFEDRISLVLRPAEIGAGVSDALGVLSLLLAVVGIYGVVSYGASQRRREVAIRLALGASRRTVVALMMGQGGGARAVVIGLIAGLALAAGAAQLLRGMLFGLSPLDPAAYVATGAALLAAAAVAMYVPSRRAASMDPAATLHED